jgi:hypothetical protein
MQEYRQKCITKIALTYFTEVLHFLDPYFLKVTVENILFKLDSHIFHCDGKVFYQNAPTYMEGQEPYR